MSSKAADHGYKFPMFAVKFVLSLMRGTIKKKAKFDIKKVSPIKHTSESFIPALFIVANGDEVVGCHHGQQLHDAYAGDKLISKHDGTHNSVRPPGISKPCNKILYY